MSSIPTKQNSFHPRKPCSKNCLKFPTNGLLREKDKRFFTLCSMVGITMKINNYECPLLSFMLFTLLSHTKRIPLPSKQKESAKIYPKSSIKSKYILSQIQFFTHQGDGVPTSHPHSMCGFIFFFLSPRFHQELSLSWNSTSLGTHRIITSTTTTSHRPQNQIPIPRDTHPHLLHGQFIALLIDLIPRKHQLRIRLLPGVGSIGRSS